MTLLKSGIKKGIEVTLNLSSKLIGNSNDKTNFSHKLLLTDTQVLKIRETFTNSLSANIKFKNAIVLDFSLEEFFVTYLFLEILYRVLLKRNRFS